jgi:hypothetical protein
MSIRRSCSAAQPKMLPVIAALGQSPRLLELPRERWPTGRDANAWSMIAVSNILRWAPAVAANDRA